MKRFISMLLVAMLLVGCLSTVAFADSGEKTGSATFTVKGEFVNFSGTVSVASPLVITSITGVTGNPANGMVAWSGSDNNYKEVSFTVNFKLPAGSTCGTYGASVSIAAKKNVYDDAGVKTGTEATSVSVSGGGSIAVDHAWDNGVVQTPATCGAAGEMLFTCSVCNATRTEPIAATGNHTWGAWNVVKEATCHSAGERNHTCDVCGLSETEYPAATGNHAWSAEKAWNDAEHWHTCTNAGCTHTHGHAAHNKQWKQLEAPTATEKGKKQEICTECGWTGDIADIPATGGGSDPDDDDVVDMGDTTPYTAYSMMVAAAVLTLCGTTALVFKRKTVK